VIQYRGFRNTDPPLLMEAWNACFSGRGAVLLQGPLFLEYFHLAKPYFDPEGLILATDENKVVGFVQTGFGPNATETALDRTRGVVCLLGVIPSHRRQGIGAELLRRAEGYLTGCGATDLHAGPLPGLNPFTFGLYGGSDSPGFLDSDALARPFFEKHGYRQSVSRVVYQRSLDQPPSVVDTRFPAHRNRYEIHAAPVHGNWWRECVVGPLELQDFRLVDKETQQTHARCSLWEMEIYSGRWQEHGVGLLDFEVVSELRRHGLARFLLWQLLRHLREQFFSLIELQVSPDNTAGVNLLRSLGFHVVDTGWGFRRAAAR
jgi:ribosomal protein S18 acetylase RimI-like enzyme